MSEERYYAKRAAGISPIRRDGSVTSAFTDRQAGAAEQFAAVAFGAPFNGEVYADRGDGGADFRTERGQSVEIIWNGVVEGDRPRLSGNLIVNPYEPQRHADLYVSVVGTTEAGFTIAGWVSHRDLVARPLRDFGFGPKYAIPLGDLRWFPPGVLEPR